MNKAFADKSVDIRQGEELNIENLQKYLLDTLEISGEINISQFPSGFSNLTYLIKIGKEELVLRRPPYGAKIKSGHDMSREYNILAKLYPLYSKVPKVICFCSDESIIGSPFYLMERINGVILRANCPINKSLDPTTIKKISNNFIDNFVELHSIDIRKSKLNEIGFINGYNERQIK